MSFSLKNKSALKEIGFCFFIFELADEQTFAALFDRWIQTSVFPQNFQAQTCLPLWDTPGSCAAVF